MNVNPANPGHFFACCGLLELADRLWDCAEGWFQGCQFHIEGNGKLSQIIDTLRGSTLSIHTDEGEPSIHPVRLNPFDLKLSWWIRDDWSRFSGKPKKNRVGLMKTELKFWAGNQSSAQIVGTLLKSILLPAVENDPDYFMAPQYLSSRFGLDSGPAWTALDVGFSINEHPIAVKASAAVELLAAIGLQRCRPFVYGECIDYVTWGQRLRPSILSAAVCGQTAIEGARYRTYIVDRGSYAALGHAIPIKGESYERSK
jgi:hypothetical protein